MENDLINREALLDEIYGSNRPEVYDGQDIANWQMECIESAPAVDAEPVRHERWGENGRCTGCGNRAPFWCMASTYYTSPYCQHCGAKMRGY